MVEEEPIAPPPSPGRVGSEESSSPVEVAVVPASSTENPQEWVGAAPAVPGLAVLETTTANSRR